MSADKKSGARLALKMVLSTRRGGSLAFRHREVGLSSPRKKIFRMNGFETLPCNVSTSGLFTFATLELA
jgi:hypothetical protein